MNQSRNLVAMAITAFIFSACQKDGRLGQATDALSSKANKSAASIDVQNAVGHVYTLSNQAEGNEVLDYTRSVGGMLTWSASYPTGGNGTGSGLGSQGALTMADHGGILLAVNAGSNSVSSLKISDGGLELVSNISSGGEMPISVAQYGQFVYVLNAGGAGNISGFTMDDYGNLSSIADSERPLSSDMSGPAQVSFVQDGKVLVVTEKATNKIISYTVNAWGIPGDWHELTAANPTPFGFAVGHNGMIYVSEADGGNPGTSTVSAYYIGEDGSISLSTGPVGAGQTAACWVAITNNGKYAYATNTGSNNVTSFRADASGGLEVMEAAAGSTEGGPIDADFSNNSKFLYVLTGSGHAINAFATADDGSLTGIQTVPGLPAGAAGLAAK